MVEGLDSDAIIAAHEEALGLIYEEILPSVVHIRVIRQLESDGAGQPLPSNPDLPLPDSPDEFFHRGEGSGFVWDEEGHIVTNNHVVDGADRVAVIFSDGTELHAKVIGTDPDSDLAVLELPEPKRGATPVELGDSDRLRVGQIAIAIGNPFGQEFTMTTGIISALGRTIRSGGSPFSIPEVIQSDVAINPGNSGGAAAGQARQSDWGQHADHQPQRGKFRRGIFRSHQHGEAGGPGLGRGGPVWVLMAGDIRFNTTGGT